MRSARALNKQIDIWQTSFTADGFQGSTVSSSLVRTVWANVKTVDNRKIITDLGLDYTVGNITFTIRKSPEFDIDTKLNFIKYRGKTYSIVSFPTDKNFVGAYISFMAVENKPKNG